MLQVAARYRRTEVKEKEAHDVSTSRVSNTASSSTALPVAENVGRRTITPADEQLERKKEMLASMKEITEEQDDQCRFYLEAAGWDIDKAIEVFSSMRPS